MNARDQALTRFFFYFIIVLLLASFVATAVFFSIPLVDTGSGDGGSGTTVTDMDSGTTDSSDFSSLLSETPDAGLAYQNQIIFFGESTTFHIASRGVLTDGKDTKQVIKPVNTTLILYSFNVDTEKLIAPSTGDAMTFAEIIALEKPAYLIMNFGINGLNYNVGVYGDNKRLYFLEQYQTLIDTVRTNSPKTVIILQAVYPVADSPDCDSRFACSATEANDRIDQLNQEILALAVKNKLYYLNSAEIMKDKNGNLKVNYAESAETDCMHINATGYNAVLSYIRTHYVQ